MMRGKLLYRAPASAISSATNVEQPKPHHFEGNVGRRNEAHSIFQLEAAKALNEFSDRSKAESPALEHAMTIPCRYCVW